MERLMPLVFKTIRNIISTYKNMGTIICKLVNFDNT